MKGSSSFFLLPSLVAVWAQVATPQPPTFRASADYVRVDVIVTDHEDQSITDLTKDDFEVLDRGRPQDDRYVSARFSAGRAPPR